MDRTGATVHGDELGRQDHGSAREKGMLCADAFEFVAGKRLRRFAGWFETGDGTKLRNEFISENEDFSLILRAELLRRQRGCSGGLAGACLCRQVRSLSYFAEFLDDINFFRMHGD